MFNLLLALITGLVIGWNFHSFFMQLNPVNILKTDPNITQVSQEEIKPKLTPKTKEIQKPIEVTNTISKKIIPQTIISTPTLPIAENFYTLLESGQFSDAMTFYIEAKDITLSLYRTALLKYFETTITTNPQLAMAQMLEFQELEPKSTRVAQEKLHNIEYTNNHTEQATILLELIKQKIDKKQEYKHSIPLQKVGEHFTLDIRIDGQPLTLLLDTGATLSMVKENKLPSSLTILKENILLNTAGGEIHAQLYEAGVFSVANIELEKFQVVASSFEQIEADGLLGMNFFKQFEFKIDQEKALLYLSKID